MRTPMEALDAACEFFGTQEKLAAALSAATPDKPVTSASISEWRRRGVVPDDRCEPIDALTHGAVPAEELSPNTIWRRDDAGRIVERGVKVVPTKRVKRGSIKQRLHRRSPHEPKRGRG